MLSLSVVLSVVTNAPQASPLGVLLLRRNYAGEPRARPRDPVALLPDYNLVAVDPAADELVMGNSLKSDMFKGNAVDDLGDTVFLRAAKRQVRYHRCYFNPISCFR